MLGPVLFNLFINDLGEDREERCIRFAHDISQYTGCMLSAKSCPTLYDPMDYSPPGSSVHGILQVRILEWVALQGIFPTQGPNPYLLRLLHWQVDSLPLSHLVYIYIYPGVCICVCVCVCVCVFWYIFQTIHWITEYKVKDS